MINFAMVGYYVSDCGCKNNEFVKLKKGGYKTPAQLEKEGYKVVQFHGVISDQEVRHTGYVFIRGKEVTIAYRGTCNSYDFKIDVEIPLIRQYELLPKGGKIHLGFYSVFENSWESLYGILKGYANDQGLEIRDLKINLTGHSMGGAVANIAALCLSVTEDAKDLHIATFGAPRVFNRDAVKVCNELFGRKTIRVVDRSDFIPSLPPNFMGYKHIGKQLKIGRHSVPALHDHKLEVYHNLILKIKPKNFKSDNNTSAICYILSRAAREVYDVLTVPSCLIPSTHSSSDKQYFERVKNQRKNASFSKIINRYSELSNEDDKFLDKDRRNGIIGDIRASIKKPRGNNKEGVMTKFEEQSEKSVSWGGGLSNIDNSTNFEQIKNMSVSCGEGLHNADKLTNSKEEKQSEKVSVRKRLSNLFSPKKKTQSNERLNGSEELPETGKRAIDELTDAIEQIDYKKVKLIVKQQGKGVGISVAAKPILQEAIDEAKAKIDDLKGREKKEQKSELKKIAKFLSGRFCEEPVSNQTAKHATLQMDDELDSPDDEPLYSTINSKPKLGSEGDQQSLQSEILASENALDDDTSLSSGNEYSSTSSNAGNVSTTEEQRNERLNSSEALPKTSEWTTEELADIIKQTDAAQAEIKEKNEQESKLKETKESPYKEFLRTHINLGKAVKKTLRTEELFYEKLSKVQTEQEKVIEKAFFNAIEKADFSEVQLIVELKGINVTESILETALKKANEEYDSGEKDKQELEKITNFLISTGDKKIHRQHMNKVIEEMKRVSNARTSQTDDESDSSSDEPLYSTIDSGSSDPQSANGDDSQNLQPENPVLTPIATDSDELDSPGGEPLYSTIAQLESEDDPQLEVSANTVDDDVSSLSSDEHSSASSNAGDVFITEDITDNEEPVVDSKNDQPTGKGDSQGPQIVVIGNSNNVVVEDNDVPQNTKLPIIAASALTIAGVVSGAAITVFLEMLAVGIAVGACCLVAATIIYCCTPKSSVENSNVETVKTAELTAR